MVVPVGQKVRSTETYFQHIATGRVAKCGIIIALILQADGRCSGLPHLRCFDQLCDDLLLLPQPPRLRSVAQQIPQSRPVSPPRAGQTAHFRLHSWPSVPRRSVLTVPASVFHRFRTVSPYTRPGQRLPRWLI